MQGRRQRGNASPIDKPVLSQKGRRGSPNTSASGVRRPPFSNKRKSAEVSPVKGRINNSNADIIRVQENFHATSDFDRQPAQSQIDQQQSIELLQDDYPPQEAPAPAIVPTEQKSVFNFPLEISDGEAIHHEQDQHLQTEQDESTVVVDYLMQSPEQRIRNNAGSIPVKSSLDIDNDENMSLTQYYLQGSADRRRRMDHDREEFLRTLNKMEKEDVPVQVIQEWKQAEIITRSIGVVRQHAQKQAQVRSSPSRYNRVNSKLHTQPRDYYQTGANVVSPKGKSQTAFQANVNLRGSATASQHSMSPPRPKNLSVSPLGSKTQKFSNLSALATAQNQEKSAFSPMSRKYGGSSSSPMTRKGAQKLAQRDDQIAAQAAELDSIKELIATRQAAREEKRAEEKAALLEEKRKRSPPKAVKNNKTSAVAKRQNKQTAVSEAPQTTKSVRDFSQHSPIGDFERQHSPVEDKIQIPLNLSEIRRGEESIEHDAPSPPSEMTNHRRNPQRVQQDIKPKAAASVALTPKPKKTDVVNRLYTPKQAPSAAQSRRDREAKQAANGGWKPSTKGVSKIQLETQTAQQRLQMRKQEFSSSIVATDSNSSKVKKVIGAKFPQPQNLFAPILTNKPDKLKTTTVLNRPSQTLKKANASNQDRSRNQNPKATSTMSHPSQVTKSTSDFNQRGRGRDVGDGEDTSTRRSNLTKPTKSSMGRQRQAVPLVPRTRSKPTLSAVRSGASRPQTATATTETKKRPVSAVPKSTFVKQKKDAQKAAEEAPEPEQQQDMTPQVQHAMSSQNILSGEGGTPLIDLRQQDEQNTWQGEGSLPSNHNFNDQNEGSVDETNKDASSVNRSSSKYFNKNLEKQTNDIQKQFQELQRQLEEQRNTVDKEAFYIEMEHLNYGGIEKFNSPTRRLADHKNNTFEQKEIFRQEHQRPSVSGQIYMEFNKGVIVEPKKGKGLNYNLIDKNPLKFYDQVLNQDIIKKKVSVDKHSGSPQGGYALKSSPKMKNGGRRMSHMAYTEKESKRFVGKLTDKVRLSIANANEIKRQSMFVPLACALKEEQSQYEQSSAGSHTDASLITGPRG